MRTRGQSKRLQEQSSESENRTKGFHDSGSRDRTKSQHGNGSLTHISKEAVGRFLKKGSSCKVPKMMMTDDGDGKSNDMIKVGDASTAMQIGEGLISKAVVAERDEKGKVPATEDLEESDCYNFPIKTVEMDETDWVDGSVSMRDNREDHSNDLEQEVTIEFSESPSSAKRKVRRASAEDKELAELVHKVHLLCLVGRGRLVDRACDDPLIQASLLSLLPTGILDTIKSSKLKANELSPLVNWFHHNFCVSVSSNSERSFALSLANALESHEGSPEEVAALSVALFRALNLTTRFVSALDVASLRPETDKSECLNQQMKKTETGIFLKGVTNPNQISSVHRGWSSLQKTNNNGSISHDSSWEIKSDLTCNTNKPECSPDTSQLNNQNLDSRATSLCNDENAALATKQDRGTKRKGDMEFELQLEMALSATATATSTATAAVAQCSSSDLDNEGANSSLSQDFSQFRKGKRIKTEDYLVSTHESSGAVWSRKIGPPMYWAEVFCSGESLNGRWVHVDAVNAIIDGEQKVEHAAAACRRPLRYVVAFAGNGAKDVTRRYCMKWYTIASQRINSQWWDQVLAPLKQLESIATGGAVPLGINLENASCETEELKSMKASNQAEASSNETAGSSAFGEHLPDDANLNQGFIGMSEPVVTNTDLKSPVQNRRLASRSSLEDMELDTKALTEPLPTNQLAYKNHHLYAIEKWLTKYQILHPKGPVLGYCSGHPVYPRTCVQTLQTKHRWLREGLQVKDHECPAKVVKQSQKSKQQTSELSVFEEDNTQGTIELYGRWQLQPLCLPRAIDGIVPKNERGQVDVWSDKCLPPGTVHLRLPRLVPIVKRLEIDFAPAMVGFEFRNGRSYPVFEGLVVCSEFKDAIMEAYAEEKERREAQEKKQNESQALSKWYQLLCNMVTRQRLKNSYDSRPTSLACQNFHDQDGGRYVAQTAANSQNNLPPSEGHHGHLRDQARPVLFANEHEHVFPIEDQSFDEVSSIRTKRCPCGFSIQVEEM